MRLRTAFAVGFLGLAAWSALRAQKPFREWPAIEYGNFPVPDDANQKTEWTRARLRYSDITGYPNRSYYGQTFQGYWTMDYPRSDRHLLTGVRRLTRIDSRSVEQVVSFDGTDDVYNWPVLYGVEVGHWNLTDEEAKQMREYLLRGGFFMCDDFHGSEMFQEGGMPQPLNEWEVFMHSINKVFPERPVEDLPDNDPIFHTVSDIQDRFQVPGALYFETGHTYEKGESGRTPHWRCIRDDKGRVMIAICHNMDLGDAWEHSDEARYLEKWTTLAYRVAMNYFIYDLSH